MSTPQPLDRRILAELNRSADTLGGLTRRLGADAVTVQRTLQQLGSLKQVTCYREDGQLLWDLAGEQEPQASAAACVVAPLPEPKRAAPVRVAAPPPAPAARPAARPARKYRPQPSGKLRAGNVTDRMRRALRDKPWQGAGDLLVALPDVKRDVIYAILSQRVKAGEFVACPPTGRYRRYAHAGTRPPAEPAVAQLPPRSVRAPQIHPTTGCATAFEQCLRFIAWAQALHGEPTAEQIQHAFGVSRATSYRWLGAWNAAQEALAA